MKIKLAKNDSGEVFFKINDSETENSFNEKGVFLYIDSIIENNYCKIPVEYDENVAELKPYADLFEEIYNELVKPDNKFKDAYQKYVDLKEASSKADDEIDSIFNTDGEE